MNVTKILFGVKYILVKMRLVIRYRKDGFCEFRINVVNLVFPGHVLIGRDSKRFKTDLTIGSYSLLLHYIDFVYIETTRFTI